MSWTNYYTGKGSNYIVEKDESISASYRFSIPFSLLDADGAKQTADRIKEFGFIESCTTYGVKSFYRFYYRAKKGSRASTQQPLFDYLDNLWVTLQKNASASPNNNATTTKALFKQGDTFKLKRSTRIEYTIVNVNEVDNTTIITWLSPNNNKQKSASSYSIDSVNKKLSSGEWVLQNATATTTNSTQNENTLPFEVGDTFNASRDTDALKKVFTISSIDKPNGKINITWEDKDGRKVEVDYKISEAVEYFEKNSWVKLPKTTQPPPNQTNDNKLSATDLNYYGLPKSGVQVYLDSNNKRTDYYALYFVLPKNALSDSNLKNVKSFIDALNFMKGAIYDTTMTITGTNVLAFYFGIIRPTPLKDEETFLKSLDELLYEYLKMDGASATQPPPNGSSTINDIKNVKEGDEIVMFYRGEKIATFYVKAVKIMGDDFEVIADTEDAGSGNKMYSENFDKGYWQSVYAEKGYSVTIKKANQPNIPSKTTNTIIPQTNARIEQLKKSISNLIAIRSTLSPIDFEKKIQIGQTITERQNEMNKIKFDLMDEALGRTDIFDTLFEQSFVPIQNNYEDIFIGDKTETDIFAPNGEPSDFTEKVNEIIHTPNFIGWFGDWQLKHMYNDVADFSIDCSKVLNKNGEPQVVWHGTGSAFSYFKFEKFPVAYFAVNKAYSKWFADMQGGGNGYTIPFFLNIRNPLDLTRFHTNTVKPKQFFDYVFLQTGMDMDTLGVNPILKDPRTPAQETWVYVRNNPKMLKKIAESHIYDGIRFFETNPANPLGNPAHDTEVYVIFEANQAKLADPNRGVLLLAALKSFLLKRGGKI